LPSPSQTKTKKKQISLSFFFPQNKNKKNTHNRRQMRLLLSLIALWLCLSFVKADSTFINIPSAEFVVNCQAYFGLPQWTFFQHDNTSFVYRITLVGFWETENSTDYDFVANSLYPNPMNGPYFNGLVLTKGNAVNGSQMVSISTVAGLNGNRFSSISLNTAVPLGATNATAYPAGKFDIEIQGYKWVSSSSTAQLVLAFAMDYVVNDTMNMMPNITAHGSRTMDFGGAYLSINSTAMGGPQNPNTSLSVNIKMLSDINASHVPSPLSHNVYIVYDHFDTNMKHDPEFGFGTGPGNSYIWIIIIVVVVIAIIVIILIAVIGFILVRRRRRSYDAF